MLLRARTAGLSASFPCERLTSKAVWAEYSIDEQNRKMSRRNFWRAGAGLSALGAACPNSGPPLGWIRLRWTAKRNRSSGPRSVRDRSGRWAGALTTTTPSNAHIRNYGLGLVGYTWEENGPSLAARKGLRTLEQEVESLASLPVRRCALHPVRLAKRSIPGGPFEFASGMGPYSGRRQTPWLRFAFRIQLSNPEFEPNEIALPRFLRDKVPLAKIGT